MAKIQIKSEKLTPFGGIFSIMEKFDSMLSPIIDQTLGQRCRSKIKGTVLLVCCLFCCMIFDALQRLLHSLFL